MQCYTELIAPSAVTHAIAVPFRNSNSRDLILAKTSLLQLFGPNPRVGRTHENGNSLRPSGLTLVGEYPLCGTVTSLAAINATKTKAGGHILLVSTRDAKLSLLQWDPESHWITTISIHMYEGEKILNQPFGPPLSECETFLTVDPASRCAALKFGVRHLAILPFKQTGDDLGGDAEDGDGTIVALKRTQSGVVDPGEDETVQTPYRASFILPLTTLDPTLTNPTDLAFLHEYRTPTLAILCAPQQPSFALLEERKDIMTYSVFSLDLEQRASTNLISVQGLPSGLNRIMPLPLPIGGTLLIGPNEFVHIDQSGKPNALAVNEFAMASSNFTMLDQSHLNMRLEGCRLELLSYETGDMLVVLNNGTLAILSFRRLGRNVSGINIAIVSNEHGGDLVSSEASCLVALDDNQIFVGSDSGDSLLLRWSSSLPTITRKRSHAEMVGNGSEADGNDDNDDVDDDDLYAPITAAASGPESLSAAPISGGVGDYTLELHDTVSSIGPMHAVCFGRASMETQDTAKLDIVAGIGRQRSGRLMFASREACLTEVNRTTFATGQNCWAVSIQRKGEENQFHNRELDNLLMVYDGHGTKIYDIATSSASPAYSGENGAAFPVSDSISYTELTDTDFEHEGETVHVGTLNNGRRLVQCRRNEIRTLDSDGLTLSQIIPMMDEETDAELSVVHAFFHDPYILVIRSDGSAQILTGEQDSDLEPIEPNESFQKEKWRTGCLYSGLLTHNESAAFLLSEDGALHVYEIPSLRRLFTIPTLPYLPIILNTDTQQRRHGAKESLTEIVVANLGRGDRTQAHLILRSSTDNVILYEPFYLDSSGDVLHWHSNLRWRKVPLTYLPVYVDSDSEEDALSSTFFLPVQLGDLHTVAINTPFPGLILKEPHSSAKVVPIRSSLKSRGVIPLNHSGCKSGLALLNQDHELREFELPSNTQFETGWAVHKVALGHPAEEVRLVAYHDERDLYVVATCRDVDFHFSEDDARHQETDEISMRPQVPRYTLHLISARTHTIIDSLELPFLETITSLKTMILESSEHTHEQKLLVVTGTAILHGEDMPAKGSVTVFDILDVVPDPELPESGVKLHTISREETRGAVTAIEPFGHGLVGVSQGQKVMVRGLKEDGTCLPVAFLDAQCYMTQLKSLGTSGLWFGADVWKGIWLGGFVEEPYKLSVLGKSDTHMEVTCAEFLPFEGQLFLIAIDASMDLHILQYDPESPKSLSGTRLLHRSTFHVGHFPTSMTLLPSTLQASAEDGVDGNGNGEAYEHQDEESFQILVTSLSGAVSLITTVDEATHRRLNTMQTNLTSILEHTGGLNPRAYRAVAGEDLGSRGVLDGGLVQRIAELGSARRAEVLARAASDEWTLRADLGLLYGQGLGFM